MGNSIQIASGSAKDIDAAQLRLVIRNGALPPSRCCTRVVLVSGEQPSYAVLSMPLKVWGDEQAPVVALRNQGPAGQIKLRTRVEVRFAEGYSAIPIFAGWLVSHSHLLREDAVSSIAFDDRWTLSKFTIFGRLVWDPVNERHYFDSAIPTIFNEMGYPNLVDSPYGPRFAPSHRYGYAQRYDNEHYTQPTAGNATARARSWTVADAVKYLRDFFYARSGHARPVAPIDLGNQTLPDEIQWPESLSNAIGFQRVLQNVEVNNHSLLSAMQLLVRKAGAFDIYTAALGNFMSELRVLDQNPSRGSGTTLFLPDYANLNIGEAMNASDVIQGGNISESIANQFDDVCITGDAPAVERMCSTSAEAYDNPGPLLLEPAWAPDDEFKFKLYIEQNSKRQAAAFGEACKIWPTVFCAYRVRNGQSIFGGTKWEKYRIGGKYARIKPAQLTGFNVDGVNPRNWEPLEIPVEYRWTPGEIATAQKAAKDDPDNHPWDGRKWSAAAPYDNLTLSPDGTIVYLSVPRDAGQTWYSFEVSDNAVAATKDPPKDPPFDPAHTMGLCMRARDIRLNLALEADWPLTGRAKGDPNSSAVRIDASSPRWTYLAVSSPMDYVEYLRHAQSRPVGNLATFGFSIYQPRAAAGQELFTDRPGDVDKPDETGRLPRHGIARLADVNRVDLAGELIFARINPALHPGLPVSIWGNDLIPLFGVLKAVTFDSEKQNTVAELASQDSATIYDSPSGAHPDTAHTTVQSPAPPTTPPTTPPPEKPETSTTTGGGGGQGDTYDYVTGKTIPAPQAQQNAPQAPETPKPKSAAEQRADTTAQRQAKAQERYDKAYAGDDPKAQSRAERNLRRAQKANENAQQTATDKKQQRAGNGSLGGKTDISDAMFGKPSSGSMTFPGGKTVKAGELQDAMFGKPSSGSIGGVKDLNKAVGSMFDTRKADQYSEKQYAANRAKENARIQAQNDAAEKRMGPGFHKSGQFSDTTSNLAKAKATVAQNPTRDMSGQFSSGNRPLWGGSAAAGRSAAPAQQDRTNGGPAAWTGGGKAPWESDAQYRARDPFGASISGSGSSRPPRPKPQGPTEE